MNVDGFNAKLLRVWIENSVRYGRFTTGIREFTARF